MPATSPLRCNHSVMALHPASSKVVLMDTGSYPAYSNFLNQTWTWDGTTWTRVGSGVVDATGPLPGRVDFGLALDSATHLVLFGGRGDSSTVGVLNDTWTWDGSVWTHAAPATAPFGRIKHQMAYLGSGSPVTVMFGGTNFNDILKETWTWNGTTWTLLSPATSPSARIDHAMAGNTTKVAMFGGKGTNSCLNDTWTFDGTTWTQAATPVAPSIRAEATMAWNPTLSLFVLFGGRNDSRLLPPETWTFNGTTTWTKVTTATAPSGRVGAQMCHDSVTGKTLLFGGNNLTDSLNDTWTFDGTVWVQL